MRSSFARADAEWCLAQLARARAEREERKQRRQQQGRTEVAWATTFAPLSKKLERRMQAEQTGAALARVAHAAIRTRSGRLGR